MKYDEYDLLWLFEGKPELSVDDNGYDGIVKYTKHDNNFEMHISFDVYEDSALIILSYLGRCVFTAYLENVTSLIKYEENLIVSVKGEPLFKLTFKGQLAVEFISSEEEKQLYKDMTL